ncbi:hypothetical protein YSY22_45920 [Brevibacillus formosus]
MRTVYFVTNLIYEDDNVNNNGEGVINILDECYYRDQIPIASSNYGENKKTSMVPPPTPCRSVQ